MKIWSFCFYIHYTPLTTGVELGPDTVISTTQDITITDQEAAVPAPAPGQTSGTVEALTARVFPGGSAVFLIHITVPGALSWQLKVTGSIREGSKKILKKTPKSLHFLRY